MIPSAAKNKRGLAISEKRQEEVVRQYLTGSTMREVSRQIGVSVVTIAKDLERARKAWKENVARSYDELLPEKIAQLDTIRAAAWVGWKRSLKNTKRNSNTKTTTLEGVIDSETIATETSSGDPRFLAQLERCLRLECELRGMLDQKKDTGEVHSEVVEVVITTREEHDEFKSLSMEQFKIRIGKKSG